MERKKIIIAIDDVQDNLISIKALVKEFFPEIQVITSQSGIDGIKLIEEYIPDVILLDIFMPVYDGYMVCAKIKQNDSTKDIPVVMITASKGDKNIKIRALESGAEAFLTKPIDEPEFIAQIRSMLKISDGNQRKQTENERLLSLVEERTSELRKTHLKTVHLMDKLKIENNHRIESEKNLIEAQQIAKIASFSLNPQTNQLSWSEEALKLFNVSDFDLIDTYEKTLHFVHPDDRPIIQEISKRIDQHETFIQFQLRHLSSSKENKYFESRISVTWNENEISSIKGTFQDITDIIITQNKLIYLSEHDYLTGLYNRMFFERKLAELDNPDYFPISIIMADINGLKTINDSFGHGRGDEILKIAAQSLINSVTKDDVIARLGGDEFVIILPRKDENETEAIIEHLKSSLSHENQPFIALNMSYGYATKRFIHEKISTIFKKAEDEMYRHKITESSSMRSKSVDLILNALFAKSPREMNHSKRVSELCEKIASEIYSSQNDIDQVRIAGLLHDIGKIGIDEAILNKNGKLSEDEYNEIKKHSAIGYRILSSVSEFSELARYVLEHQEKNDGTGYPNGLRDKQISKQAKIIAVADAYDAMTSERTYRKALSMNEAIDELLRCSNTQFDLDIVKVLVEKVLKKDTRL